MPTGVWTGSEMIVWGGNFGGAVAPLDTGGRYSPSSDSWGPTAVGTNVPTPRTQHTAIWTGAEMIVWGGQGGDVTTSASGGRDNPATSSWSPTRLDGTTPDGRYGHSAVWTGTEMIVWGGS